MATWIVMLITVLLVVIVPSFKGPFEFLGNMIHRMFGG